MYGKGTFSPGPYKKDYGISGVSQLGETTISRSKYPVID